MADQRSEREFLIYLLWMLQQGRASVTVTVNLDITCPEDIALELGYVD